MAVKKKAPAKKKAAAKKVVKKVAKKAPAATDGLTGFNVELKPAGGEWAVVATTGPTELTHSVTLTSSDSWTQFRVTSVYSDGQTASAKIFGLAGQYK